MSDAIEISSALAKRFEGLSTKPYVCPAGYLTIGYGHRCGKEQGEINVSQAEYLLAADLMVALKAVLKLSPSIEGEARLAALIDFVFNLGAGRYKSSTLRKRVDEDEWEEAKEELMKWVYGGGKRLKGLVLRRIAEAALM